MHYLIPLFLYVHTLCMLGSASPLALSLGIVFGVILLVVIGVFVVILLTIIFKRKSKHYLIMN